MSKFVPAVVFHLKSMFDYKLVTEINAKTLLLIHTGVRQGLGYLGI